MDENASKALLLAAEVLIGVIILSIFAYVFERAYLFAEHYKEISDKQKIIEFNTKFTSYITNNSDMKYIYAEDVVTLANQAISWNESTADDNEKITVKIYGKGGGVLYEIQKTEDFNEIEFLEMYKLIVKPPNDPASPGYNSESPEYKPESPEYKPKSKEYQFSCEVYLQEGTGRVNQVIIRNMGPKT